MIVVDNHIVAVEPTDEQYDRVIELLKNYPEAPEGYVYMLNAETLEWEMVEVHEAPPDPDPELDDAEALEILLGGAT